MVTHQLRTRHDSAHQKSTKIKELHRLIKVIKAMGNAMFACAYTLHRFTYWRHFCVAVNVITSHVRISIANDAEQPAAASRRRWCTDCTLAAWVSISIAAYSNVIDRIATAVSDVRSVHIALIYSMALSQLSLSLPSSSIILLCSLTIKFSSPHLRASGCLCLSSCLCLSYTACRFLYDWLVVNTFSRSILPSAQPHNDPDSLHHKSACQLAY